MVLFVYIWKFVETYSGKVNNMKSTGIVRKIDELGRVVLPIELRRNLEIAEKDPVEIFVDEDMIVLKKYTPSCVFCSNTKNVIKFKDKNVCESCLSELAARA